MADRPPSVWPRMPAWAAAFPIAIAPRRCCTLVRRCSWGPSRKAVTARTTRSASPSFATASRAATTHVAPVPARPRSESEVTVRPQDRCASRPACVSSMPRPFRRYAWPRPRRARHATSPWCAKPAGSATFPPAASKELAASHPPKALRAFRGFATTPMTIASRLHGIAGLAVAWAPSARLPISASASPSAMRPLRCVSAGRAWGEPVSRPTIA
jgi:hypothetical protein